MMMRKIALVALLGALSSAFGAEEFGGLKFHSTVEKKQVESLKNDLRYLYKSPIESADADFLKVAQLNVGDGPNMHNWLLNRIRYIYGEKFTFDQKDMIVIEGKFPNTPVPEFPDSTKSDGPKSRPEEKPEAAKAVTVMSNMGSAFYVIGKMNKAFIGFNFDGEKVFVKSPRTGILQVGEGLFHERFLFNKDVNHVSNSISRMATLFHEARHSDGNSKHTGFMHALCPVGHRMVGNYACEASANGPYSIGALSQKHMLKNCKTCSTREKTALAAGVADSFSRVIEVPFDHQVKDYRTVIKNYKEIAKVFKTLADNAQSEDDKAKFYAEVIKIDAESDRLNYGPNASNITYKMKARPLDPTFEGIFTPVSLQESTKIMERSLLKK